jgi:hypothetical protein
VTGPLNPWLSISTTLPARCGCTSGADSASQNSGTRASDPPDHPARPKFSPRPLTLDPYRVAVIPAFTFEELAADRVTPGMLPDRMAAEGKEGLVAKPRSSTYVPGCRPDAWLQHPLVQTREVIACGWRPGRSILGTSGPGSSRPNARRCRADLSRWRSEPSPGGPAQYPDVVSALVNGLRSASPLGGR